MHLRKSARSWLVAGAQNGIVKAVALGHEDDRRQLKMITCAGCGAKVFLPADLQPLATTPCPKCGFQIMMPMRMRQFELRSFVASGGNGAVFRAFDTVLEREVAVKVLKPELADDPDASENFYREARICASLNHTNIIHIYAFDEFEKKKYLVMELADQGSLDGRIELYQRLEERDALNIGIKIASALALTLKHGYIHCDIKPGNILFDPDNEPKLVDFGLARKIDVDQATSDDAHGTPYYVAPEKIKREPETFLSDMYSLGGTLYHALTGHVPFEAPTVEELVLAHVNVPLTPPNQVIPEISQPTSDAILRAMAKNPAERFQSYDEFILAFEEARGMFLRQQILDSGGGAKPRSWWKR